METKPSAPGTTDEQGRNWGHVLAKIPLFAGFGEAELVQLGGLARERRMRRGEVLIRAGEAGHFMLVVLLGEVRVSLGGASGQEHVVNQLGAGAVFGEISLFDGRARTADVVAATNGRLLVIERATVEGLLARESPFARSVIIGLCAMLRDTMAQLEAMVFQDVATRLAMSLLRLARGERPRRLDITQAELGQLVGASREIVNKRLRAMAAEGIIELSPGRIVLVEESRLAAMLPGKVAGF